MTAEEFAKHHFPGIEKETWYPALIGLMEGYRDHLFGDKSDQFIADAIKMKSDYDQRVKTFMDNCKKFGEFKLSGKPIEKFPPIELKNLKNPD